MAVTVEQAAQHWRERAEVADRARREAAARARAGLPILAGELRRRGAQRVVLFGSLAERRFREESDIDLAVVGLPAGALLGTGYDLTLLAGRPVEVLRLEEAPPTLIARIAECGEELP